FFSCACSPRHLHSFPTRRSSDLGCALAWPLLSSRAALSASGGAPSWPGALMRSSHLLTSSFRSDTRVSPMPGAVSRRNVRARARSEEHTSELQSPYDLVCRLLLE